MRTKKLFAMRATKMATMGAMKVAMMALMLTGLGTGAKAQGTVTFKEGTEDADKWEVKSGTTTVVLDTTAAGLKAACEIVSIVIE